MPPNLLGWALLLIALLFPTLSAASDTGKPTGIRLLGRFSPVSQVHGQMKQVWKRRRGGGSDWGGSSDTSVDDDDDDASDTGSNNNLPVCQVTKNVTQKAHNSDSYGSFYRTGNGSPNSNEGGYTPEGSGTHPVWDNSTGEWMTIHYNLFDQDQEEYHNYLGGASVPYASGEDSPNGVHPVRLDLDFEEAPPGDLYGDLCTVPNSSYAYKYNEKWKWRSSAFKMESFTRFVPMYCCCALYSLCGCDDFHSNSSFVPTLVDYLMESTQPLNNTHICAVDIDGMALIINGTVSNGSTKANPAMDPTTETVAITTSQYCEPTDSGYSSQVNGGLGMSPPQVLIMISTVATTSLGILFGVSLILL
ncbi:Conserved glycine-rich protein [Aspergillus sclerotialis]|uniref:Conserved glycine-rich protein n=1 Tax=Aspergillus sclerotialis TaxID=2070753 RepID=A0A3A2Z8C5_9EURO|nr:Conserved glycine-rich protein [Aspergillus sclerotialis]